MLLGAGVLLLAVSSISLLGQTLLCNSTQSSGMVPVESDCSALWTLALVGGIIATLAGAVLVGRAVVSYSEIRAPETDG